LSVYSFFHVFFLNLLLATLACHSAAVTAAVTVHYVMNLESTGAT